MKRYRSGAKTFILAFVFSSLLQVTGCALSKNAQSARQDISEKHAYQIGFDAYRRGDYDRALGVWKPLVGRGNERAITAMGLMYQNGKGVAKDLSVAAQYYQRAADMGYAAAQNNLAVLFEYGHGVTKNPEHAVELYTMAADKGYATAHYNLGRLYQSGVGVARDFPEAIRRYEQAETLQRQSETNR